MPATTPRRPSRLDSSGTGTRPMRNGPMLAYPNHTNTRFLVSHKGLSGVSPKTLRQTRRDKQVYYVIMTTTTTTTTTTNDN